MMHRLRKVVLLTVMFAVLSALPFSARLSAQTAQRVEDLLNREAVSWSDAAYFALEAAEKAVPGDADGAFQFAASQNWLPKNVEASGGARLNGIALLLMRAFDLKGGLFYTLFKNPHYSYRELVYKEVIQGKADPEMTVSGQEFLFMINRILTMTETGLQSPAPAAEQVRTEPETVPLTEEELEQIQVEQQRLAEEITVQIETQHISDARVSVTTEGVTISLTDIQFLADSAELTEPEKEKIREIAQILWAVPERHLLVAGHTALAGTSSGQQQVSLDRAQAVADYLVWLGVRSRDEIQVEGRGSERPIADNTTEEGMALNRRVEIIILTAGNR